LIVLDASVAVEMLLGSEIGRSALEHVERESEVHVPEHFYLEALSVLRRYALAGEVREPHLGRMLTLLAELRAIRYPALMLAEIWELRAELTVYDAAYLALARLLDARLLTLDAGLAAIARRDQRLIELS
jgi:predicted nucleic acid-binding protein